MHVDKVMVEEEESSSVDMEGVAIEDIEIGEVPESGVKSGVLVSERDNDSETDSEGSVEYEYVDLADVTEGWAASLKEFIGEHIVPIACAAIVILCMLILSVGRHVNSVLIAVGFVFIIVIFGIALYFAWKERQRARQEYEYAKRIYDAARNKMMEEYDDKE